MNLYQKFEFGDTFTVNDRRLLQGYLESLWQEYISTIKSDEYQALTFGDSPLRQGFLSFDGESARPRNFIGFIQQGDTYIEIYPKVFKGQPLNKDNSELIIRHLFWWLEYAERWRFPFDTSNLDTLDCHSLPELIIRLIAREFWKVLSENPLLLYQEEEASMSTPRGRINFPRYLERGLSRGNGHILECDHMPLLYDNNLNRAIKYVTRLLIHKTNQVQTQRMLEDVLFLLDEVTDEPCTSKVLDQVQLNPAFGNYGTIVTICRMVLDQNLYNHQAYNQECWTLLLPMEIVFEDFIAGFFKKELREVYNTCAQKGGVALVESPYRAFEMRVDMVIEKKGLKDFKIIIDTKYKTREGDFLSDPKRGISQSDMYQMAAYALRHGCRRILLLYPNLTEDCREPDHFKIRSAFDGSEYHIIAADVPFWSFADFSKLKGELAGKLKALVDLFV